MKGLFQQLGLPRRDFEEYRRTLHELIESGELAHAGKRKLTAPHKLKFIEGILRLTPHGYGFIDREEGSSIFISAREAQKAFDGDRVKVEVRDRGHAAGPEGAIVEVDYAHRPPLLGRLFRSEGRWLAEIKSGPLSFTAAIHSEQRIGQPHGGDWALLHVLGERRRWPLPSCHIEKLLGNPHKKGIAEKGLLASYGFSEEYPATALQESAHLQPEKTQPGVRRDLRREFVVTIDPAGAWDHDDAVSLRRDQQGGYHLSVHIADVSCYVPEGSEIDQQARQRAFSVYLLHHHLPMLPPKLPADLCSLKPGRDRLALSVLMQFDRNGKLLKKDIVPSRLRVRRLISYERAQEHLDPPQKRSEKQEKDLELRGELQPMWELAAKLREKRLAEGGVDFDLPEPGFHWEDGAAPSSIFRQPRLQSHQLIEEFMLAANRAVAEIWAEQFGEETANVFRVHPPLDATKREKLVDYLADAGFDWPRDKLITARQIAQLLDQARRRYPQEVTAVIARKALTLARYDTRPLGHFGLGFGKYLHFTSPIRRYADLMVHRLIWKYLVGGKSVKNREAFKEELDQLCQHLSQRERVIAELEREANKLAGLLYLEERREEVFPARLVEVYQDKFFVGLEDLYIEGVLAPDSGVRFRPSSTASGQHHGKRAAQGGISIGQRLEVQISRIDLLNRKLELKPA